MKYKIRFITFSLILTSILSIASLAQSTGVDTSFHAVPSAPIPSINSLQQLVQPDGKIVIWGASLVADGVAKGEVLRLNANGSVDQTFSYCGCGLDTVENLVLQSNGQFIVGGSSGQTAKMIRLNLNGSLDSSFVSGTPPNPFGSSLMNVVAIQPDGKILAYRRQQTTFGSVEYTLFRFNQDGSVDSGFTAIPLTFGSPVFANVGGVIFLPDGKFYLALTRGNFAVTGSVERYNYNGTVDTTWDSPDFTSSGFPNSISINAISLEMDGSLLVAGKWDAVNGLNKRNLIRLLPAGNVDVNFSPVINLPATGVEALPGGKILYSKMVDVAGIWRLFRLNSDGTTDNTFTMDPSIVSVQNKWMLDTAGRIVFFGLLGDQTGKIVRLLSDGGLDSTFNTNLTVFGIVNLLAKQNDGKFLIVGNFSQINGTFRSGFARVDSNGNLDTTFNPGTGFSSIPRVIEIQSDGKILAVGGFLMYNGISRPHIARINADGSLDSGFAPIVDTSLQEVSLQPDGKIIISGSFTTVNGVARTRVARLEANGNLDTAFNPIIGNGTVNQTIVQPDGKIVIAGSFSGVNGFNRSNLVRLNADGTLDQTFNAASGNVTGIWIQPDGKYIVATTSRLSRKNADGSNDSSFVSTEFSVSSSSDTQINSVLIRADGSLIVGGRFDTVGGLPRRNLTRLKPNGELDTLFSIVGVNQRVFTLISGEKSKILMGGEFTKVEQTPQPGISRLIINQFRFVTPFDFDGDGRADILFSDRQKTDGIF